MTLSVDYIHGSGACQDRELRSMSKRLAIVCLYLLCRVAATAQDHAAAEAHHQQGMSLYRAHDAEGPIRELTQAVEIDPGYAPAWNDLGVIQRQRSHLQIAIDCFRKAVAANPQF